MLLYYIRSLFSRGFSTYLTDILNKKHGEKLIMKEKLTLVVSGIKIDIVTEDDPEYVKSLGRLLENRVSDLVIASANRQKNEALLLCALDYLDERNKLKAENERLKAELAKLK